MRPENKDISLFWLQEDCGEEGTGAGEEFITIIY